MKGRGVEGGRRRRHLVHFFWQLGWEKRRGGERERKEVGGTQTGPGPPPPLPPPPLPLLLVFLKVILTKTTSVFPPAQSRE